MEISRYLEILHVFERLKNTTRHSYTSENRKESVAEHSYRLAIMAYFVKDEFLQIDIKKVILMCLFHDIGEAFTGDIPCFEKTNADEENETQKVTDFLNSMPLPYKTELKKLFEEMELLQSKEAKLYKALDNMEVVIQHNEADISTWLPLEYDLQLTYGEEAAAHFGYTKRLKEECKKITLDKIKNKK